MNDDWIKNSQKQFHKAVASLTTEDIFKAKKALFHSFHDFSFKEVEGLVSGNTHTSKTAIIKKYRKQFEKISSVPVLEFILCNPISGTMLGYRFLLKCEPIQQGFALPVSYNYEIRITNEMDANDILHREIGNTFDMILEKKKMLCTGFGTPSPMRMSLEIPRCDLRQYNIISGRFASLD